MKFAITLFVLSFVLSAFPQDLSDKFIGTWNSEHATMKISKGENGLKIAIKSSYPDGTPRIDTWYDAVIENGCLYASNKLNTFNH